ncbi:MAG: hypothetical protein ABI813_11795 [Bacteroidota bacterium]
MRFLLFICFLGCTVASAQLKVYTIGVKGDTLNGVDKTGKKQGKWVLRHDEVRGEPGFVEEGVYKNDHREGSWRKYTLMGDLFAVENYRWGFKDGTSQYFNMNGELLKEESWRAFNPDKVYDTIEVEDVMKPNHYDNVVIKNEGSSLKHGSWKYYDPETGFITKTEFWILGKLEQSDNKDKASGLAKKAGSDSTAAVKAKPKEVMDFEKKNAGKKKVRVRDGSTF